MGCSRLMCASRACLRSLSFWFVLFALVPSDGNAQLPDSDGEFYVSAQEWADRPGPRSIRATVHYPNGFRTSIARSTGLMLILHNWGGSECDWAANPKTMAASFDVVAICVDYLQSGADAFGPEPYEFGLLQAGDALRALRHVFVSLVGSRTKFNRGRIYAVGASGGGLVALMANKLAPRTFAGIVAIAPLVKLNSDIALGLPGNSPLNARWGALPAEHSEIRDVGNPKHLRQMRKLKTEAQIVLVHGVNDDVAPFSETQELFGSLWVAGIQAFPYWITPADLDGEVFIDSAHALGHRTLIAHSTGGEVLHRIRRSKTDFEKRDRAVRYGVTGGTWTVNHRGAVSIGFQRE